MKKLMAVLLAIGMMSSLLIGCGSDAEETTAQSGVSNTQTEETTAGSAMEEISISMAASDIGGEYYTIGALFNTLWEENLNALTAIQPGGSTSNVKSVSNGDAQVGWTHSAVIAMAKEAKAPFDQVYDGVSAILSSHPAAMHCMVLKDSDITSLGQLEDKKIGLGTNGSLGNTIALQFLEEEFGITEASITSAGGTISYLGQSEAGDALRDEQIDIWIGLGPYPFNAFSDLFYSPGLNLVELEADKMAHFLENHPEYTSTVIPAGTYDGIDKDLTVICSYNVLAVRNDMDEELVYQMTKAIWENIQFVYDGSTTAEKFMSIEEPCGGWQAAGIHPGAQRYYDEVGVKFE